MTSVTLRPFQTFEKGAWINPGAGLDSVGMLAPVYPRLGSRYCNLSPDTAPTDWALQILAASPLGTVRLTRRANVELEQ
jgi:hypothetical protein